MLKVSKHNTLSGGPVDVTILFINNKGETVEDKQSFAEAKAARSYIRGTQRSWIIQELQNYILHKKQIISASPSYNNISIHESLGRSLALLNYAGSRQNGIITLDEICRFTLKTERHLEKILPYPMNKSYNSSREKLAEIISFCKETIIELKKEWQ